MNWIKRHPLFFAWLLVCGAVLLGGTGWIWRLQSAAAKDARKLAEKKQERDWLAAQNPAPSPENAETVDANLAAARAELAALRTALQGKAPGLLATPAPEKPIDAFFEIATFVEKTRARAMQASVVLKPDERFGFASYANEGPEIVYLPAVHRQLAIARDLLEALLEARPRELVAVRRERPLTREQGEARWKETPEDAARRGGSATMRAGPPGDAGGAAADFFVPESRLVLRTPGVVEGECFKVEFLGQTAALRAFLNTVAEFKLPVIVRSVEVEPLAGGPGDGGDETGGSLAGAPVPVITQNFSRFAVVLECVELPPETVPPAS